MAEKRKDKAKKRVVKVEPSTSRLPLTISLFQSLIKQVRLYPGPLPERWALEGRRKTLHMQGR